MIANDNIVTGFNDQVNLADLTGTMTPATASGFTSGQKNIDNINITKKYVNNRITVTKPSSGEDGQTNFFNIAPDVVNHIIIRNSTGGLGSEVGDLNFDLNEQITLYAAGYDEWNNYVRDIVADWDTTGNIDRPSPLQGTFTVFNPTTPYTSGRIYADSVGADTTGLFTVGTVDHVLIRDGANGSGDVVGDLQITADDSLVLYAAAYDGGNSYLGAATVS